MSVSKHVADARHRRRRVVLWLAATVAFIIVAAIAISEGAWIQQFLTQVQQWAADNTYARREPVRPSPATAQVKPPVKRQARKARPAAPEQAPDPSTTAGPSSMGDFAEVVDHNNRHYLVRYRPAPVVPLPEERVRNAADTAPSPALVTSASWTSAERDLTSRPSSAINLRSFAPGSAGIVVLQGIVGTDGMVRNLKVVSGPAELATSAKQAAERWQYVPEYVHGLPVERAVLITVDFTVRLSE